VLWIVVQFTSGGLGLGRRHASWRRDLVSIWVNQLHMAIGTLGRRKLAAVIILAGKIAKKTSKQWFNQL